MIKNIEELKVLCKSLPKEIAKEFVIECSLEQYNTLTDSINSQKSSPHILEVKPKLEMEDYSGIKILGFNILLHKNDLIENPLHYYILLP